MLSNFFLKLDYFTRIVGMAKFHDEFHATKKVEIPCMGNSLPAQQTIPRTKHLDSFSKKDFCKNLIVCRL